MAQLMVRKVSDELVKALKQQAEKHNRSAEQEHRVILKAALQRPRRRHLADVLRQISNLGKDNDLSRNQRDSRERQPRSPRVLRHCKP
jgi:antitoxin FitA